MRLTPLQVVHAALLAAAEEQDAPAFAAAAARWKKQSGHYKPQTFVEWVVHEIDGGWAVSQALALGYPVSRSALSRVICPINHDQGRLLPLWKALLPAVEGRVFFQREVLRRLVRLESLSKGPWSSPIDWRELELHRLFSGLDFTNSIRYIEFIKPLKLTPLQYAWAFGAVDVCEALVEAGARPDLPVVGSSWPGWSLVDLVVHEDVGAIRYESQKEALLQKIEDSKYRKKWAGLKKRLPVLARVRAMDDSLPAAQAAPSTRGRF